MKLLGAIGKLMDGSGLKESLQMIYGENAMVHMMSRKAVQRSFREYLLRQCLMQQIAAKVIEVNPGFKNFMQDIERLYTLMEVDKINLDMLLKSDCVEGIVKALDSKKCKLSNGSKNEQTMAGLPENVGIAQGHGKCIAMLYLSAYPYLLLLGTQII